MERSTSRVYRGIVRMVRRDEHMGDPFPQRLSETGCFRHRVTHSGCRRGSISRECSVLVRWTLRKTVILLFRTVRK